MINVIKNSALKLLFVFTLGGFLSLSIQAPVMAGMISSHELNTESQVELKRDEIRAVTARDEVKSFLLDNGVSEDDLNSRIDTMTDAEVLAFHAEMENLPAGGFLGAVLAIIVIFMLLDMAGATDIFPNI